MIILLQSNRKLSYKMAAVILYLFKENNELIISCEILLLRLDFINW